MCKSFRYSVRSGVKLLNVNNLVMVCLETQMH